jgi:excisionase family DNA binding protein
MPDSSSKEDAALRSLKGSAKFLGIGLSQIYRLVKAGEIDVVRLGPRSIRITQESLDRFVEERKVSKRK